MKAVIGLVLAGAIVVAVSAEPSKDTAPFHRVTQMEAWNAAAAIQPGLSPDKFESAFEKQIRKLAPEYDNNNAWVWTSDALWIAVVGPVENYCSKLSEQVRKMEPLKTAVWSPNIDIVVQPQQIDSPDIVRVVVTRNGAIVPPETSTLLATEMTTRMGAKAMLHSGNIGYAVDAFAPGAKVVVTAIPDQGRNIVKTFTDAELRRIQ